MTKWIITEKNKNKNKNRNKIITWKSLLLLSCYRTKNKQEEDDHLRALRPISINQRLSLSDLSDPSSPLSIDDLSNSFTGQKLQAFTLGELRVITSNFAKSNFLGEGGFGPVYKGFVDDRVKPGLPSRPVAVKALDLDGQQGHREWLAEIIFLGQLRHKNLVKLIGYCWEEEHRMLIYEYMPRGSLENQLFRRYSLTMPWSTRMKIALGAARGLAFLHEAEKPVIYRDFKTSNILLDSEYNAKLSDFGLAKDGPDPEHTHVTTRVMGTQGYAAPEYIMTGHLTAKSDVYSFGVVLLELITGRRSMDNSRPGRERSLVEWARPMLRDPRRLDRLMDPRLEGRYPLKGARAAAMLANKCLSHQPKSRPIMGDVVKGLESAIEENDGFGETFVYVVPKEAKGNEGKQKKKRHQNCQKLAFSDSALYKRNWEVEKKWG